MASWMVHVGNAPPRVADLRVTNALRGSLFYSSFSFDQMRSRVLELSLATEANFSQA